MTYTEDSYPTDLVINSEETSKKDSLSAEEMYKKEQAIKRFEKEAEELNFSGQTAQNYVKSQLLIWEKEQRKKAEEDAKILGSAMQQLLPEIFEEKRAIPNCFLLAQSENVTHFSKWKMSPLLH